MRRILIFAIAFFTFSMVFGQEDVRATCKSSGLKIQAYVKPTQSQVAFPNSGNNNVIAIIVVFSLPANGATNTSMAPMPVSVSCPAFPTITFTNYPVALANDRFIYTYYNNPVGVATQTAWAVNVEKLLLELTFTNAVNGIFPRLDNLWNSGGGPNFFDYFYFEVNGFQRSDTFGQPFYDGNMGNYPSSDQYVEATTALPIRLLSFDANKKDERSSHLSWTTSSEINSSHFIVQRSFDKTSWENLGRVEATGNSQIVQSYEYLDPNVYNGRDRKLTAYYRLLMVDIDDWSDLSPVKSVLFGNTLSLGKEIAAYPNPAADGIQVEWDADQVDQPSAIEFYDVNGKLIYVQKVPDQTNQQYIDFGPTNIQTGLYLMRLMKGDQAIDHKQIVVSRH